MRNWILLVAALLMPQCRTSQPTAPLAPPPESQTVKLEDVTKAGINIDKFPSAARALQLAQDQAKQVPVNPKGPGAKEKKELLDAIQAVKPGDLETLVREHKCTRTLNRLVTWYKDTETHNSLNLTASKEEEDKRKSQGIAAIVLGGVSFLVPIPLTIVSASLSIDAGRRILTSDGKDDEVIKTAKKELIGAVAFAAVGSVYFGFNVARSPDTGTFLEPWKVIGVNDSNIKSGKIVAGIAAGSVAFLLSGVAPAILAANLKLTDSAPDFQKLQPEEKLDALSLGVFAACAMEELKASEGHASK